MNSLTNFIAANTRLHILEQFIASSWISRHILDCSNISKSNIEAHKWNGIALCTLTLVHVWSILLPCLTHNWKAQVVPGIFEWPLSERTPPGFKDANAETQTMSLQVDDVFRMVEMTILLAILTPLSIRWMQRYWHVGIKVHQFITVLYFVDIVRRHSHPHSWCLNTPIFIIWILDKMLSRMWRHIDYPDITSDPISKDYMVLYWKDDSKESSDERMGIGSNFYMKMTPSSWLEPFHTFTAFKNRAGSCNTFLKADIEDIQNNSAHSHGAIIRIFHNKRKPRIGKRELEDRSQTERMANACANPADDSQKIRIWGPYQGNLSSVITKKINDNKERTLVLVGSGSAVNFMIDFLSYMLSVSKNDDHLSDTRNKVVCLYSSRDEALNAWVEKAMTDLLGSLGEKDLDDSQKAMRNSIRIVLASTSKKSDYKKISIDGTAHTYRMSLSNTGHTHRLSITSSEHTRRVSDFSVNETEFQDVTPESSPFSFDLKQVKEDESKKRFQYPCGSVEVVDGRLDYKDIIPERSDVFCQGSLVFNDAVKKACRSKRGVRLYFE